MLKKFFEFSVVALTIFVVVLVALYTFFSLGYDTKGITYTKYAVNKLTIVAGEPFKTIITRCSNNSYPIKASTYLVDGSALLISSREGIIKKGCDTIIGSEKVVPIDTIPGEYNLKTEVMYTVKWLFFTKVNHISISTPSFNVK